MASVGAQPGNRNAAKGKPWTDAINRALARYEAENDQGLLRKGLDVIADEVVRMAAKGDMFAVREISERVEGKVKQQTELSGLDGAALVPPTIAIVGAK